MKNRLQFTTAQVQDALLAVCSGNSPRNAARDFGIPRTTLKRKLMLPLRNSCGPATAFTREEEDLFATLLKEFKSLELPLTRCRFIHMVKTEGKRKGKFCYISYSDSHLLIGKV